MKDVDLSSLPSDLIDELQGMGIGDDEDEEEEEEEEEREVIPASNQEDLRTLPKKRWMEGMVTEVLPSALLVRPANRDFSSLLHRSRIPQELLDALRLRVQKKPLVPDAGNSTGLDSLFSAGDCVRCYVEEVDHDRTLALTMLLMEDLGYYAWDKTRSFRFVHPSDKEDSAPMKADDDDKDAESQRGQDEEEEGEEGEDKGVNEEAEAAYRAQMVEWADYDPQKLLLWWRGKLFKPRYPPKPKPVRPADADEFWDEEHYGDTLLLWEKEGMFSGFQRRQLEEEQWEIEEKAQAVADAEQNKPDEINPMFKEPLLVEVVRHKFPNMVDITGIDKKLPKGDKWFVQRLPDEEKRVSRETYRRLHQRSRDWFREEVEEVVRDKDFVFEGINEEDGSGRQARKGKSRDLLEDVIRMRQPGRKGSR